MSTKSFEREYLGLSDNSRRFKSYYSEKEICKGLSEGSRIFGGAKMKLERKRLNQTQPHCRLREEGVLVPPPRITTKI